MIYVDKNRKPSLHPRTRKSVRDSRVVSVVIKPGGKARQLTVRQWIDPGYLERMGIPKSTKVFLQPIIVDAVPSLK